MGAWGLCNHFFTLISNLQSRLFEVLASRVCPGYNTTLTALGANSYVWVGLTFSAGIANNPFQLGIYTVTGSNGGACTGTTVIPVYLGNPFRFR